MNFLIQNQFRFTWLFALMLSLGGCTDVSDVTDPDTRGDIASWYKEDGAWSSSSVAVASSSSLVVSSSSSVAVASSSSLVVSSSSSVAVASSSSVAVASSSSVSVCTNIYGTNTVTDCRDSNTYTTVVIGNQIWMAKNLAYLPSVNGYADYSNTMAKYYVYNYIGTNVSEAKADSNYTIYGVLYNWTAALSACPHGWHLPRTAEWDSLESYLGGPATAGTKLKAETGWNGTGNGTNDHEFSALPGGSYSGSEFSNALKYGYWWTTIEKYDTEAYYREMSDTEANVNSVYYRKSFGFSVRCVKD